MFKIKRITVPCDNCKKKFVVRKPKKKIHRDAVEGLLTIYYITCKHCETNFVSFVENEKLKNLVKENKKLQSRLGSIKDDDEYIEAQEKFEKQVAKADMIRRDLIFRFSKYV